jgi:hypothetical protein
MVTGIRRGSARETDDPSNVCLLYGSLLLRATIYSEAAYSEAAKPMSPELAPARQ